MAPDREAIYPAPAACGTDIGIEAVPVAISSGATHVAHDGGRERVLGVPITRLPLGEWSGKYHAYHYIPNLKTDARVMEDRHETGTDPHVS